MERRLSDVSVTFKRRRKSVEGLYGTATQLVSCAPTQELHGDTAVEAAPLPWPQPHSYLPARPPRPAVQLQQQPAWGLCHDEATFWRDVDGEQLVETESRQTTPGASRAASPGPLLPCTAPQQAAADLAAFISQQLGEGSPLLGSEEIRRHYPRAQEQYQRYRECMAEQRLSPLRLREFFKHSQPRDRGAPAL